MAHRNERGVVRDRRDAARRRLRALSIAALAVPLTAGLAAAQAPAASFRDHALSGAYDLPAWWAEPGRPGWNPWPDFGASPPWALAGHTLGAWAIEEPGRAPSELPFPGIRAMPTPLAYYDSARVRLLDDGAWRGYAGAFARAADETLGLMRPHARGIVELRNGDFGLDENALTIERVGSGRGLRGETMSGNRGAVAGFESSGRHHWGVAAFLGRDRHRLEGTFAHRGAAARLAGGEEQHARGQSGSLGYRYRRDAREAGITFARGVSRHESFADEFSFAFLDYSQRDAQEVVVAADAAAPLGGGTLRGRLDWRRAEVTRIGDGAFDRGATSLWGAARFERTAGPGALRLDLGAGHHGALDGVQVAPALSYAVPGARFGARLAIERRVVPVWSDLAVGQEAFLQSTWAGVLETEARAGTLRARTSFLGGRTRDRALFARAPLEELWLRAGALADLDPSDFGLAIAEGEWLGSWWQLGGEGFGLFRSRSDFEPRVDPRYGAQAWAGVRFAFFQGDLGITLRGYAEGISSRESENLTYLPGYVTGGAVLLVSIADALVTVRVRNLEDARHRLVWVDSATGVEALGPGRELRLVLTMRLQD